MKFNKLITIIMILLLSMTLFIGCGKSEEKAEETQKEETTAQEEVEDASTATEEVAEEATEEAVEETAEESTEEAVEETAEETSEDATEEAATETEGEILFSFSSEGSKTLDCYSDNTYKFEYADYGVVEMGTWSYDPETYAFVIVQEGGNEIKASIEGDDHVLTLEYIAVVSDQLVESFTCVQDVWTGALY